jgi:hypothetical protein
VRTQLLDPTAADTRLADAIALAREIYTLFERGADYSSPVRSLGILVGHPIHDFAVRSAFGSVRPETFAKRQLIDWDRLPSDLSRREMLEIIDKFHEGKLDEFYPEYWIECLRVNTGDGRISDLIFWPGSYFGDGDDSRLMSSSEILETALKAGGKLS